MANIARTPDVMENADKVWQKLKEMFNAEAAYYDPEDNISRLGSVGPVNRREVLRGEWWAAVGGSKYGDYKTLTSIIEEQHNGEKLETGTIIFGS